MRSLQQRRRRRRAGELNNIQLLVLIAIVIAPMPFNIIRPIRLLAQRDRPWWHGFDPRFMWEYQWHHSGWLFSLLEIGALLCAIVLGVIWLAGAESAKKGTKPE